MSNPRVLVDMGLDEAIALVQTIVGEANAQVLLINTLEERNDEKILKIKTNPAMKSLLISTRRAFRQLKGKQLDYFLTEVQSQRENASGIYWVLELPVKKD